MVPVLYHESFPANYNLYSTAKVFPLETFAVYSIFYAACSALPQSKVHHLLTCLTMVQHPSLNRGFYFQTYTTGSKPMKSQSSGTFLPHHKGRVWLME